MTPDDRTDAPSGEEVTAAVFSFTVALLGVAIFLAGYLTMLPRWVTVVGALMGGGGFLVAFTFGRYS